jgi:hypothetical protein
MSSDTSHANATDTIVMKDNGYQPYFTIEMGGRTLKLGIDSGAAHSVFTPYVKKKTRHHFISGRSHTIMGANGRVIEKLSGVLVDLEMHDIKWAPLQCFITRLDHVNRLLPTSIDGLLGYHFLCQYKMAINFKTNQMYLWDQE